MLLRMHTASFSSVHVKCSLPLAAGTCVFQTTDGPSLKVITTLTDSCPSFNTGIFSGLLFGHKVERKIVQRKFQFKFTTA